MQWTHPLQRHRLPAALQARYVVAGSAAPRSAAGGRALLRPASLASRRGIHVANPCNRLTLLPGRQVSPPWGPTQVVEEFNPPACSPCAVPRARCCCQLCSCTHTGGIRCLSPRGGRQQHRWGPGHRTAHGRLGSAGAAPARAAGRRQPPQQRAAGGRRVQRAAADRPQAGGGVPAGCAAARRRPGARRARPGPGGRAGRPGSHGRPAPGRLLHRRRHRGGGGGAAAAAHPHRGRQAGPGSGGAGPRHSQSAGGARSGAAVR